MEHLKALGKVDSGDGSIQVAMFSFTNWRLMHDLLDAAEEHPSVPVQVFLDQSALVSDNPNDFGTPLYCVKRRNIRTNTPIN